MKNQVLFIKVYVIDTALSSGSIVVARPYSLIPALIAIFLAIPNIPAYSEIFWSPDGKWLSFRQDHNKIASEIIKPGWLFHPESLSIDSAQNSTSSSNSVIWIGRSDRKIWHKVKETSSDTVFLSQPAWSVDGRSLYYAAIHMISRMPILFGKRHSLTTGSYPNWALDNGVPSVTFRSVLITCWSLQTLKRIH
jgi:hypothetical protein